MPDAVPACLRLCAVVTTPQIQTLDIPGEVKAGYSPIGFVRCGRAACKVTKINWKVSRHTRAGEQAEWLGGRRMARLRLGGRGWWLAWLE